MGDKSLKLEEEDQSLTLGRSMNRKKLIKRLVLTQISDQLSVLESKGGH